MAKAFASTGDLKPKTVSFTKLGEGLYAYTAEGDPNTGVIVGDDGVMVIDAQATPTMAKQVIARIRKVTDKPIKYVVLSHYHAVRVMGASAYKAEQVVASEDTYDLIVERGKQDFASEVGRFPRLFDDVKSIPGLTWPTQTFRGKMTVWMGKREVQILQLGRGHTKGDTVVWLPKERVLFSGDLVEYGATPYAGDAYLRDWPATLDALKALKPRALVPGRGDALTTPRRCVEAIDGTKAFVSRLYKAAAKGVKQGKSLNAVFAAAHKDLSKDFGRWVIFEHCMPFDVTRAFDEASGIDDPRIWTMQRDKQMWKALQGS